MIIHLVDGTYELFLGTGEDRKRTEEKDGAIGHKRFSLGLAECS